MLTAVRGLLSGHIVLSHPGSFRDFGVCGFCIFGICILEGFVFLGFCILEFLYSWEIWYAWGFAFLKFC